MCACNSQWYVGIYYPAVGLFIHNATKEERRSVTPLNRTWFASQQCSHCVCMQQPMVCRILPGSWVIRNTAKEERRSVTPFNRTLFASQLCAHAVLHSRTWSSLCASQTICIIIIMKNLNRCSSHGHHGSKCCELAQRAHSPV